MVHIEFKQFNILLRLAFLKLIKFYYAIHKCSHIVNHTMRFLFPRYYSSDLANEVIVSTNNKVYFGEHIPNAENKRNRFSMLQKIKTSTCVNSQKCLYVCARVFNVIIPCRACCLKHENTP